MRKVRYAIIGAGTVGLTALDIIKEQTDDYVLIQLGEWGTTCARVGCMPSKAMIHAANHFFHAKGAGAVGVKGVAGLTIDHAAVMQRVRRFRDRFVKGINAGTVETLPADKVILGAAHFVAPHRLEVNGELIEAERIIIGTGSRPVVPATWREKLGKRLLTSDTVFELETLPRRVAVVGLGVIGLELGQALSRLGVDVIGFEASDTLSGLRYPEASAKLVECMSSEFAIYLNQSVDVDVDAHCAKVRRGDAIFEVDAVLVTMGRTPNIDQLGLENLNVALNDLGMPPFNPETMQVADLPVFIAGDASGYRPILHEAGDEGKIAALNAVGFPHVQSIPRKTPLGISFIEPGAAYFGDRFDALDPAKIEVAAFDLHCNNGRAIVMDQDHGLLCLFADSASGQLLGGELVMPQAEHLAHLLAWCVQQRMTVAQILQMPFYHPVLEEAVASVLKQLNAKLKTDGVS
ncbi:dihydrolipoyl dehydrogenase [Thiomicrospira microaerophila]|uniref:dihydrolipoyl dehydrogenase n=1 Tax=Thiomicrospira microaerophila TaxID=406020 RepID=UPI0005CB7A20|nr:dihydrolipoyl dehydrogenase [Thiomicrospira microaerophila]